MRKNLSDRPGRHCSGRQCGRRDGSNPACAASREGRAEPPDHPRRVRRCACRPPDRPGYEPRRNDQRRGATGGDADRRAAHADARFAKLDANGDGSISRAEFDAGHAARPDRGPHGQPADAREGRRGGPRHAMRGPGRDGHERGPVVISEVAAKLGERFDKMDADHDGMISPAERRAAMTAHRAERQARRAQRQAGRPGPQAASPAPASE